MKTTPPETDAIRQQILADIERAFGKVERDNGITIHEAEVIDAYGSEEERQAARMLDTETRWQDVPAEVMNSHAGFCFLDLKGLRYYLPAYMTWVLKHLDSGNSVASDNLLYSLVRMGAGHQDWHAWRNVPEAYRNPECVCRFDGNQREVIRRYLEYLIFHEPDRHDAAAASEALENWKEVEKRIATDVDRGQRMIVQCTLQMPDGSIVEMPPE